MTELFIKESGEDCIAFSDNGTLGVSTYSYCIDSCGEMILNKKETRELFDAMEKYYKREEIGQAVDSLRGGCHE